MATLMATLMATRKRLTISGVVQGVGFRPFLWRLAHRLELSGWVENVPSGVVTEVQGAAAAVATFIAQIDADRPPLAVVERVEVCDVPPSPAEPAGFVIHAVAAEADRGPDAEAVVPPDSAACGACLAEVHDRGSRRHRHPFANCTDCGPRYTIIRGLPYDRTRTTMQSFAMCRACAAEYADPADRRFHAQPIACPACGPTLWFSPTGNGASVAILRSDATCLGDAALEEARKLLRAGGVVAIKGIGGFHLACDATSSIAVGGLRRRKKRIGKPLAVMAADVGVARRFAAVTPQEERLLESRERPIVLVSKQPVASSLAPEIAPGNDFVGIMLPAMPLQHLLCAGMPPLVMTSGNLSEEPIVHDNHAAVERLAAVADGFLMHDRDIETACDDSVVRCAAGAILPIRRSRGFTPLPIRLAGGGRTALAVGGELKAAVCLLKGDHAVMSQHIGDVGNLETVDSLARTVEHMLGLFGAVPEVIACDMHPGYLSAAWAREWAAEREIPIVAVQHHEAHVAALVADHGGSPAPLIGVCFDGTGYGRDGTIWGGEFFLVPGAEAAAGQPWLGMRRIARLAPFLLPGGDAAIRHPWRTALAVVQEAGCEWHPGLPPVQAASDEERRVLGRQLARRIQCVPTSSMGRLFDAVASLVAARQSISYEAEAAMNLEAFAARGGDDGKAYELRLEFGQDLMSALAPGLARPPDTPGTIDWRPGVREIVRDTLAGVPAAVIAARFHRGVADMIAAACHRLRQASGIGTVGLTGGVFQNAVLVRLATERLHRAGFDVLLHAQVPANDGGLALGQAFLAARG